MSFFFSGKCKADFVFLQNTNDVRLVVFVCNKGRSFGKFKTDLFCVLQCVAVCCSLLQCVAVCRDESESCKDTVLQCIAVCVAV